MEATDRVDITVLPTQYSSLPFLTASCFFGGSSTPLTQVRGSCRHIQFKYPHPLPPSQEWVCDLSQANQNPFPEFFYSALEKKSFPGSASALQYWTRGCVDHIKREEQEKHGERDSCDITVWFQGSPETHLHLYPSLILLHFGLCHLQPKASWLVHRLLRRADYDNSSGK